MGRKWLLENHLDFKEINLITSPPSREALLHIFRLTDKGPEDIISTRGLAFKALNVDLKKLTTDELIELIQDHPQILRRPIIVDDTHLQIGYNEDDIGQFIPRDKRQAWLKQALESSNAEYEGLELTISKR